MKGFGTGLLAVGVMLGGLLWSTDVGRSQGIGPALPAVAMTPPDNPSTPARVALGRLLFWDPILSGNRDTACGTCHHPRFGYAENRDLSIGVSGTGLGDRRHFEAGSAIPSSSGTARRS